jgi:hypothetical protein
VNKPIAFSENKKGRPFKTASFILGIYYLTFAVDISLGNAA